MVITFETTVTGGATQVENQSWAFWDENGDGTLSALDNNLQSNTPELSDDPGTTASSDPTVALIPSRLLPDTGFAPDRTSSLLTQDINIVYTQSNITLIIPTLQLRLPITGIPYLLGSWNTTWLGDQAGYLEGSAYPTHPGNTVLTAHVWDSFNQPGPFSDLTSLVYGDRVIIETGNTHYLYLVQSSQLVGPGDTQSVFRHQEADLISLVTCENWDEGLQVYTGRRLVRAILVSVKDK